MYKNETQEIVIEAPNESRFDIGKKQWEMLSLLTEKYEKMDISSITSSKFEDKKWLIPTEDSFSKPFIFESLYKHQSALPLIVLLKIFIVYCMKVLDYSHGTVYGKVTYLITSFCPQLLGLPNPILSAEKNAPWVSLAELGVHDLYLMITNKSIDKVSDNYTSALSTLEKAQEFEDLQIFLSGFLTPWTHEGVTSQTWTNSCNTIENKVVSNRKPYSSFSEETISGIVKSASKLYQGISVSPEHGIELSNEDRSLPIVAFLTLIKRLRLKYFKGRNYTNLNTFFTRDECFQKLLYKEQNFLVELNHKQEDYLRESEFDWYDKSINAEWFTELFSIAQSGALWVVLLSTGLRNVDLRNLKTDCLKYSKQYKIWFLECQIKKTRNTIYIPIGEPCIQAIKLLKLLNYSKDSNFLVQNRLFSFAHGPYNNNDNLCRVGNTINRRLSAFAKRFNIKLETISEEDEEGTCHCIRATLAGYIGTNSTLSILILKKLFGHSNMLMPDQYIRHNVLVQKQRKTMLESMHSQISHDIAVSIANKEIAGPKSTELLKGASHLEQKIKVESKNLSEVDVHKKLIQVLAEIILCDIQNEQTNTLLTPMAVICMRATNHSKDSPCSINTNRLEREKLGVSRAMFSALPRLPNPSHCIGIDCADALATKMHSLPLLEQFDWYTNVLRECTDKKHKMTEDATHFIDTYYPIVMSNDMLNEAELFRKKYGSALFELYSDNRPEGYFDVK